jgi:CubicO group peptidase (beta-lactamase class C family)
VSSERGGGARLGSNRRVARFDSAPGLLERLPDRLGETGAAALSLAVIRGYEVAEARAWGLADVERGLSATETTLFQAGSISKPVSCFAVLRLTARGDLDLDRDVNEYLTTWKVPPVDGWQPRLTLRC